MDRLVELARALPGYKLCEFCLVKVDCKTYSMANGIYLPPCLSMKLEEYFDFKAFERSLKNGQSD